MNINFLKHPSSKLSELYKLRNYQGANPNEAKILFVGKDPNWASNIEDVSIFEAVHEYLSDGIKFWKKYQIHHPFLLPEYKGDGTKYHKAISRLNLKSDLADKISFIELIGFPTTGMSSRNPKQFNEYLLAAENRNHLEQLSELLKSRDKLIFLYWGLIDQLKSLHKSTGLFENFLAIDKTSMTRTDLNKVGNLYFHKHFSMGISPNTLHKISEEIIREVK